MSLPLILLVGAGGHARACIDVIEREGRFAVSGLIGLASEVGSTVLGYPVLGSDEDLPVLTERFGHALVAVGQIKTSAERERIFARLMELGCALPTIVSPLGYVSRHAQVGSGTIVMHGAIVNAAAAVGQNCILNSHSLVEHDAVIGDHCHVSTNAAVNSGVQVGRGTFIGSGSSVRQGLAIGAHCVIGMGQRVLANCVDGQRIPSLRAT